MAAGPRTPEEALRRRIRRHLLPTRVRRPRAAHRVSEGVRRRVPRPTSCRSSSTRRRSRSAPRRSSTPAAEEQKHQHISAALRGDEVLVQLLSEPSGGSDLAGVITRADRDGDKWVINGAKTWSTSAFAADYGLMLARTDWDVPKHEGLTMFLVPINSPGITLRRIKQVNGSRRVLRGVLRQPRARRRRRRRRGQRGLARGVPAALPRAARGRRRLGVRQRHRRRGQDRRAHRLRRPAEATGPGRQRARPRDWRAARWCTGRCGSS